MKTGTETNGRPAAALYVGKVMHARMKPKSHRFTYVVASMLLDIDRLDQANSQSILFSVNRGNLVSFRESDHGFRDERTLRQFVDDSLCEHGIEAPARVELLCYPRIANYVFNPISVYFCYDEADAPIAIIYEVHNTFGEAHAYVEPVRSEQISEAGIRQQCQKAFHVSPFLDMEMTYRFRLVPPGEEVGLRILETDRDGPILSATFFGRRRPLNGWTLAQAILKTLGIPWKVIAAIHYEALRLWWKGLRIYPKPGNPRLRDAS